MRQRAATILLISVALLCGFTITAQAQPVAPTVTVTLNDLTDPISLPTLIVTGSNTSHTVAIGTDSATETYTVTGTATTGTAFTISTVILTGNGFIADPGNVLISDQTTLTTTTSNYSLTFTSDPNPGGLGSCPTANLGGCGITENGMVQDLLSVTWSDGSVDTISFQSDKDVVPEPSAILMLLPGLVGVYAARRSRFFVQ